VFYNIKFVAFEIFRKVHTTIKNVDFFEFLKRKPFKWFLTWWPQKIWKFLNFWNESYMVNFKPILNTLEMYFQLGF